MQAKIGQKQKSNRKTGKRANERTNEPFYCSKIQCGLRPPNAGLN